MYIDVIITESDQWQAYRIKRPSFIVGNYLRIDLIGKHHKQFEYSGYYCCISQVMALGCTLEDETFQPIYQTLPTVQRIYNKSVGEDEQRRVRNIIFRTISI
jgi:hypothetical protein